MAEKLSIKKASDALALVSKVDDVDFDNISFENFEGFSIKLRGKNYNKTITPPVMHGFDELQKSIYRAYALIKTGNDNIKSLSHAEKKSLEIAVYVGAGSSDFRVENAGDLMELFKAALRKMTGKQALYAVAIIAVLASLYLGKEGYAIWAQLQIDEKKIEEAMFADVQDTERLNAVMKLAEKNVELAQILVEADRARRALTANALDADSIEIDGRPLSRDTAEKILEQPAIQPNQTRLDGQYKVLQMNASNDEYFSFKIQSVATGQSFNAKIDNLVLEQCKEALQRAIFDREPVSLRVNATLKGETVADAFVVAAAAVK